MTVERCIDAGGCPAYLVSGYGSSPTSARAAIMRETDGDMDEAVKVGRIELFQWQPARQGSIEGVPVRAAFTDDGDALKLLPALPGDEGNFLGRWCNL